MEGLQHIEATLVIVREKKLIHLHYVSPILVNSGKPLEFYYRVEYGNQDDAESIWLVSRGRGNLRPSSGIWLMMSGDEKIGSK